MPALSCLRCSACFLDAVGPRGWRDGCGAQVARCIGVGSTRAAGRARSTAHPDRNGRRGGWRRAVGAMRAAKRDAYKTAAMNAGGGGHKRDGGGAHAASRPGPRRRAQSPFGHAACRMPLPRVACRCRMAQSPFGRTAGRCRGKAARRWQHLRAMRDFGLLDAKVGPWRQDSHAMYPESPDCARKRMHGARMLPS